MVLGLCNKRAFVSEALGVIFSYISLFSFNIQAGRLVSIAEIDKESFHISYKNRLWLKTQIKKSQSQASLIKLCLLSHNACKYFNEHEEQLNRAYKGRHPLLKKMKRDLCHLELRYLQILNKRFNMNYEDIKDSNG